MAISSRSAWASTAFFFRERDIFLNWPCCFGKSRPLLLSSTVKSDNFVFTADLANVDVSENQQVVFPRGTLHIVRSRFLWQGVCYEEFKISNYGLTAHRDSA